jgi:hypothetical protein
MINIMPINPNNPLKISILEYFSFKISVAKIPVHTEEVKSKVYASAKGMVVHE